MRWGLTTHSRRRRRVLCDCAAKGSYKTNRQQTTASENVPMSAIVNVFYMHAATARLRFQPFCRPVYWYCVLCVYLCGNITPVCKHTHTNASNGPPPLSRVMTCQICKCVSPVRRRLDALINLYVRVLKLWVGSRLTHSTHTRMHERSNLNIESSPL